MSGAPEPLVWEATTPGYIRFISHSRYLTFRPYARKWYRPICQRCSDSDTRAKHGDKGTLGPASGE